MTGEDWQPSIDGSWDGGILHMGQNEDAALFAPPWWWFLTDPKRRDQMQWSRRWKPWKIWQWPRYWHSRLTDTVTWLEQP